MAYPQITDPLFSKEHQDIVSGQSIGAVFKGNGWSIDKQHTYIGEIENLPETSPLYSLMGNIAPTSLAIHIYSLFVSKNGNEVRYAWIAEIQHPAYLTLMDLKVIYDQEYAQLRNKTSDVLAILDLVQDEINKL